MTHSFAILVLICLIDIGNKNEDVVFITACKFRIFCMNLLLQYTLLLLEICHTWPKNMSHLNFDNQFYNVASEIFYYDISILRELMCYLVTADNVDK